MSRNFDSVAKYITGTWIWKEQHYYDGNLSTVQTPQNSGFRRKLVLRNDTAWFYKSDFFGFNNKVEAMYRFRLAYEHEFSLIQTDSFAVFVFGNMDTGVGTYAPIAICKNQFSFLFHLIRDRLGEQLWVRQE